MSPRRRRAAHVLLRRHQDRRVGARLTSGSGCMTQELSATIESEVVDKSQLMSQWARVRGRLQSEVGELEYRNWLRQMTLASLDGDEITVLLPTRFLCDWVRARYGDRLNSLWHGENPAVRRVDIRVGGSPQVALAESLATNSEAS